LQISVHIVDMLFTEYNNLFDVKHIVEKVKLGLKRLDKKFDMLTITLTCGNEHDCYPPVVESYRFLQTDGVIKYSRLRNNKYGSETSPVADKGWIEAIQNPVLARVAELAELGNTTFINALRESQKVN
jgi:hypothetical protein